jgi:hypothetical protein
MEWIRVKDKLPPLDVEVLLQMRDDDMNVGYRANCFRFKVSSTSIDYPLNEVYAWTYLPEPCYEKYSVLSYFSYFSAEQFLGCICNVLIELGETELYYDILEKIYDSPLDIVFAKLYNNNIISDFCYDLGEILEVIKNSNSEFCECFKLGRDKITIDKNIYIEKFKQEYLKDIDTDVQEKIETCLREFFLDRKRKKLYE